MTEPLYIAKASGEGGPEIFLEPRMANRHGLVAGATGTGKTVTLQTMAENFSRIGVPVFVSDIKGDVSGISQAAGDNPKVAERVKQLGLADWTPTANPVVFWDVFGTKGHPIRAKVSEMGPLLLGRLLNLNDTQSGVLSIIFKIADDKQLLLIDLKDLRALVKYVGDNAADFRNEYGNVSPASVGAIQRGLLALEQQGADKFFGEPALNLDDLLQTDSNGQGVINVLAADKLIQSPKVYATMLLWLLSELFETLPEIGDPDKPKLVFFFDEAHLLFDDAPDALQDKIEQVVRLIRSKGVGIYFVSQLPIDVPDKVLGQLGNRVQHALRAFTPRDQKAVKVTADTFRSNPNLDISTTLVQLGVGEALVSFLDEKGTPGITERAFVLPPRSQIGAITDEQRAVILKNSVVAGVYDTAEDKESAYEVLRAQAAATVSKEEQKQQAQEAKDAAAKALADQKEAIRVAKASQAEADRLARTKAKEEERQRIADERMKAKIMAKGVDVGGSILRGVLGSMLGGRR